MLSEEQILAGIRQSDRASFRNLVDIYQVKVLNICQAYLHNRDEAEDIAQDVFIEVFESIHKFRGDSRLGTWITRIAINKAINRSKKLKRQSLLQIRTTNLTGNDLKKFGQFGSDNDEQHQSMTQKEDQAALNHALDKLPDQQKNAFILQHYEELSYQEIAEVLGISLSAVESLLFRSRNNLRRHLEKYILNR
jgi:RNA polymerase sigma-70 factor (family 1)